MEIERVMVGSAKRQSIPPVVRPSLTLATDVSRDEELGKLNVASCTFVAKLLQHSKSESLLMLSSL
jgi:hypothetical protein